jgi:hypothetical protein
VFIFGHGRATNHAVNLGNDDQWLEMKSFREAIGENVAVTVISTACFSGGWSVNPQLNITTSTRQAQRKQVNRGVPQRVLEDVVDQFMPPHSFNLWWRLNYRALKIIKQKRKPTMSLLEPFIKP